MDVYKWYLVAVAIISFGAGMLYSWLEIVRPLKDKLKQSEFERASEERWSTHYFKEMQKAQEYAEVLEKKIKEAAHA